MPPMTRSATMATIDALVAAALKGFAPPPELNLCQWAEENFRLPQRSSAQPGRFTPWPPQREVLDAMGDPLIERVTVMKSARVGYTKGLMAALGSLAVNTPCSVILLVPTDDDARGMAVDEVEPSFAETPALEGLLMTGRLDGRNTLTMKSFPGGSLKILAAKAPRNLRRHDAKALLIDEVDAMTVTPEGDPVRLCEKRTLAHPDRKIICGSTPTIKGLSRIEKFYAQSDARVYETPCPECAAFSEIVWEQINWTEGHPETAEWCCPNCGSLIAEKHKFGMVSRGRWRATRPDVKGHAGFHLTALTSMLAKASWAELAAEWEQAQAAGPEDIQVFVNTVLGRPYEMSEEARTTPDALYERRDDYGPAELPEGVLLITAFADVQADRFEVQFWGWGRDDEVWVIDHAKIACDPTDTRSWDHLDAAFGRRFRHPLGRELGVESAGVDSGYLSQLVYDYARRAQAAYRPVYATKGVAGAGRPIWAESKLKVRGGAKIFLVGVDDAKTMLYQRLARREPGPGFVHFPGHLERDYFRQLVSERVSISYRAGLAHREWVLMPGHRNEALDTAVGCMAARYRMRIDYDARAKAMRPDKPKMSAADVARMMR
jgi:phage terminase large subunit GpA-like protein